jgi:uncharacterized membrane protein YedE/YeeE
MTFLNAIEDFPILIKRFIVLFVLCLATGYFTGFDLIYETTALSATGIVENYVGNEHNPSADLMKFKKPEKEILVIIHTHVISFALIFFALGILILTLPIAPILKKWLLYEPFFSIVITFGSIYLIWKELPYVHYLAMISGILLTVSFLTSALLIIYYCVKPEDRPSNERS